MITGSGSAGTHTSSSRFQADHRDVGDAETRRAPPRATLTCGAPPSTTNRFGGYANRRDLPSATIGRSRRRRDGGNAARSPRRWTRRRRSGRHPRPHGWRGADNPTCAANRPRTPPGRHHVGAQQADVRAPDAQGRQRDQEFLNILQRGSRVEVTGTLEFVLSQRSLASGAPSRRRALVAAMRHPQLNCDPRTRTARSPAPGIAWQHRDQHSGVAPDWLPRRRCRGSAWSCRLGEELLDEQFLPDSPGSPGFDDPATLAADRRRARGTPVRPPGVVIGERHHVGVSAVTEHRGLLLQHASAPTSSAAGRPARSQLFGGSVHLQFDLTDQASVLPAGSRSPPRSRDAPR